MFVNHRTDNGCGGDDWTSDNDYGAGPSDFVAGAYRCLPAGMDSPGIINAYQVCYRRLQTDVVGCVQSPAAKTVQLLRVADLPDADPTPKSPPWALTLTSGRVCIPYLYDFIEGRLSWDCGGRRPLRLTGHPDQTTSTWTIRTKRNGRHPPRTVRIRSAWY